MNLRAALAALIAASLALPASAAGNFRAGRVRGVAPLGLGTQTAIGSRQLSASTPLTSRAAIAGGPILTAPSDAPQLPAPSVAPEPAQAVAPVAAALPSPAAAAVAAPAGDTGVDAPVPAPGLAAAAGAAESVLAARQAVRSGADGEARLAGITSFDGGRALVAASDAPPVPGAAPEDRRSSGLAPPSAAEIAAAFRAARPGSPLAPVADDPRFAEMAADIFYEHTFAINGLMQQISYEMSAGQLRPRGYLQTAQEFTAIHDAADPAARRFVELMGRWFAFMESQSDRKGLAARLLAPRPHMPPNPLGEGEYWDMAAGINGGRYTRLAEVDRKSKYVLFDVSPFALGYIAASADIAGKSNVEARSQDLMSLTRPAKPLSVLRTKNASSYVRGFERKLEEMADWIAPGGQLIIQADAGHPYQHQGIVAKHGPLVKRLIAEGWAFEFGFSRGGGKLGKYGYDTLILTRPSRQPVMRDAAQVDALWSAYVGSVMYLSRRSGA